MLTGTHVYSTGLGIDHHTQMSGWTLRAHLLGHRVHDLQKIIAGASMVVAFSAVYLFWGSTFLAAQFAIDTIPPFLMSAVRFLIAGGILLAWAIARGAALPRLVHLRTAFITGGLMLLGGAGVVVWAEQYISSGLAGLLVATVPLWAVVIAAIGDRKRPSLPVMAGLALGTAGIGILVGPGSLAGDNGSVLMGSMAVLGASFSWALGTQVARKAPQAESGTVSNALNMIAGGLMLTVAGGFNGEFGRMALDTFSLKSGLALAYLILFGSLIGFSAYMWLVKNSSPARASSNFYVNPLVAVFLGWLLAGETLTGRTLMAAAVIAGAVLLIVTQKEK